MNHADSQLSGSHLSDEQLLLDVDGELSARDENRVKTHLHACWKCRVRRQELENAITDFVRLHQQDLDAKIPPAAGPRALLKARISHLSASAPQWDSEWFRVSRASSWITALCVLVAFGVLLFGASRLAQKSPHPRSVVVSIPDSRLTPGATLLVNRVAVCSQSNVKNKPVPSALQRKVFEEYGMTGVDPRAYEVDYLVTPALGGADDIHNLWPHSYSATAWNAQVKDRLEDRLRGMVCDGSLDLTEAQREIASNWIAAYKKYFHTNQPLTDSRR